MTVGSLSQPHTSPRIPIWLKIGAAVMIIEYAALFVLDFGALGAIGFGIGCVVVWLLVQGSRVAWSLGLFGAATQIAFSIFTTQPLWAATSIVIGGCLLMPASRKYIWTKKRRGKLDGWQVVVQRAGAKFRDVQYTWLGRLLGIGEVLEGGVERRAPRLRNIIWMLAIWVVVLLPFAGTFDKFHHGSARGSVIIDVLWHLVWIGWTLGLLALVALLCVSYSAGRRKTQVK